MRNLSLAFLALLAACQAEEPGQQGEQASVSTPTATPAAKESAAPAPGPAQAIRPQAIDYADIEANGLAGAGCAFLIGTGDEAANVFLSDDQRGAFKLNGRMVLLAPDTASPELPYLSRQRYTGEGMSVHVEQGPGEGAPYGDESMRWPGSSLTARDNQDRVIYQAKGMLECGA